MHRWPCLLRHWRSHLAASTVASDSRMERQLSNMNAKSIQSASNAKNDSLAGQNCRIISKSQDIAIVANVIPTFQLFENTSIMPGRLRIQLHITAVTADESTPIRKP